MEDISDDDLERVADFKKHLKVTCEERYPAQFCSPITRVKVTYKGILVVAYDAGQFSGGKDYGPL